MQTTHIRPTTRLRRPVIISGLVMYLLAALCVCELMVGAALYGDERPSPEGIAKSIQTTFDRLPGIHLKWTVRTEVVTNLPKDRSPSFTSVRCDDEFAWDHQRQFRHNIIWYRNEPEKRRENHYLLSDGTLYWHPRDYASPSANPTLGNLRVSKGEPSIARNLLIGMAYLEFIGSPFYDGEWLEVWRMYRYQNGINEGGFKAPRPFPIAAALRSGQYRVRPEREVVDGAECWIVESPGADRLWLDEAAGFAIKRREWSWPGAGNMMCRIEATGHQDFGSGLWLPKVAKRDMFVCRATHPEFTTDTIHFSTIAELSAATIAVLPDTVFAYTPPPGTLVLDDSRTMIDGKPAMLQYTHGRDPKETEASMAEGLNRLRDQGAKDTAMRDAKPKGAVRKWWYLVAANLIIAASVAVFLLVRRWRRRNAA